MLWYSNEIYNSVFKLLGSHCKCIICELHPLVPVTPPPPATSVTAD